MLLTGVILILAIFAVIGWRKGVIRLVLSLVSMIVTILAAVIIAPLATTAIRNETNIDENMAQSIYTILSENKEVDQYFSNEQMIPDGINISQAGEHLQNISKAIMEVGDRINLPESLTDAIKAMPESELMTIINEQGQASIKEISLRIIALRLSNIILTAIIYIVIFIVLRIIIGATGIIRRLPIIKQADKLGGVIVGLIEGLVVVWIFFTVVTAISGTENAANILAQIHKNAFLEALYNNNPITRLLFSTIR